MESYSPGEIVRELARISSELQRGAEVLNEAEVRLAELEQQADTTLQRAYIDATGTDKERTAKSRLQSSEARFKADLAKVEVNRIKLKIKTLENAQMATQTISRIVMSEMRIV